jgi:predicted exporter
MTANAVVNRKQRVLICIWFSLILCLSVFCIQHIRQGNAFESNILGLLPSAVTADISSSTNAELGIERKFVLLIGSANPSAKSAFDASRNLLDQLAELNNVQIDSHNGNQLTQLQNFYQPYINQLLTPMWRHRLSTDTPQKLAQTAYAELFSPCPVTVPIIFNTTHLISGGLGCSNSFPSKGNFVPQKSHL